MLNNTNLKYKLHILTSTNNNPKTNYFNKNFQTKIDFISQSIDNLKQTIDNILYRQFKSIKNIHNNKFQYLLNYINQLLITFKNEYQTQQNVQLSSATADYFKNEFIQEMILKDLYEILTKEPNDFLVQIYFEKKINFLTKQLFDFNRNSNHDLYQLEFLNNQLNELLIHKDINHKNWKDIHQQRIHLLQTLNNKINNPTVYIHRHETNNFDDTDKKTCTSTNLSFSLNGYGPPVETNITNNIRFVKDDYTQKKKQVLKLPNRVINRLLKINDAIKPTKEKLDAIYFISNRNGILQNLFQMLELEILKQDVRKPSKISGLIYNRSSSAYTSKKRSHRDQSTPMNIISPLAENLDDNHTNTFKSPSDVSDIYIKLSDCQAACRRWAVKQNKRNPTSPRSHHRHRKTKLPICYRKFPMSFNAVTKKRDNNHSFKDMQTKVSVDIRKISCKTIHSKKKIDDSFICIGTGTIDFVDGPNGPVLCLQEEDSKNSEQICLYRRILKDEQFIHSFISNDDDETSFDSNSKQSSISILTLSHSFNDEKLEILPIDEHVNCKIYQIPSEVSGISDMIPACILIFIDSMTRASAIQSASLPKIIRETDITDFIQYKSLLNIRLINNIRSIQDHQSLKFESLDLTIYFDYHLEMILNNDDRNQLKTSKHSNKDNIIMLQESYHMKETDLDFANRKESETTQLIVEEKILVSIDENTEQNDSKLYLHAHENDVLPTKSSEYNEQQKSKLVVNYDQSTSIESLTNNTELKDTIGDTDVISRIEFTSNISTEQSVETLFHMDRIDIDDEIPYSDSVLSSMKQDQFLGILNQSDSESLSLNSKETQEISYEVPIKIPKCVHLHDSFELIINQTSDPSLSTASIPKYASISHEMKTSLVQDEDSSFSKYDKASLDRLNDLRMNDEIYHNEPVSSESPISAQSNQRSSELKASSEPLSIQTESIIPNQSDDVNTSRIMSISRKPINNTIEDKRQSSLKKQTRHFIMNFQSEAHMINTDKIIVDSSSPIKSKRKTKLPIVRSKPIPKKQTCIRPTWISSKKNPIITKPINRTSFSLKQLRDPCQVLDLYTRFKRINCIPYECVCMSLPPCCDISSCSFIKNAHICNTYLMQNNNL